jgi:hypothetical protein
MPKDVWDQLAKEPLPEVEEKNTWLTGAKQLEQHFLDSR